jgi:hypothetical protein
VHRQHRGVRLIERQLQAALLEVQRGQPALMRTRPRGLLKDQALTQEQLGEAVTGTHQITARVLAGAHQIPRRLLVLARHAHRHQLVAAQPPRQQLGVAPVSLDAIARRALELLGGATTQPTPAAASARANTKPVGPASYATHTGAGSDRAKATTRSSSGAIRCEHNSPLTQSSVAAHTERACTSRPTAVPCLIRRLP